LVAAVRQKQKGLILYFQPLHQLVAVVEVQETRLAMLVGQAVLVVELHTQVWGLQIPILAGQEMKVDIHPQKETTEVVTLPIRGLVLLVAVVVRMRLVQQMLWLVLEVLEATAKPLVLQGHR
jgi:hypothetical protein